jgi:hypothetical protein
MSPFGWFQEKKKTMCADDAAALPNLRARVRIDAATISGLTPIQFEAVDAMMFYTRAAVIIQCLRLSVLNSANRQKVGESVGRV